MDKQTKQKFRTEGVRLAFILRHKPENYGLDIQPQGWVSVAELKEACDYDDEFFEQLVLTDDKGRYEYNADKTLIRALQGHSHPKVKIEYFQVTPPNVLFHGTTMAAFAHIVEHGLNKMERHHVHMHDGENRAILSAVRRKSQEPILVRIDAKAMHEAGLVFYRTDNDVWLTEHVPPIYLTGYWPKLAKAA